MVLAEIKRWSLAIDGHHRTRWVTVSKETNLPSVFVTSAVSSHQPSPKQGSLMPLATMAHEKHCTMLLILFTLGSKVLDAPLSTNDCSHPGRLWRPSVCESP